MKLKHLTLFFFLFLFQYGLSQPEDYSWSNLRFNVNKNDSAFLLAAEAKMWNAVTTASVQVYDGYKWGCMFNVRTSQAAFNSYKDSLAKRAVAQYEMTLMWEHDVDVFHVMSFNPLLRFQRHQFNYYSPLVWDTAAWVRIPLLSYSYYLSKEEFSREQKIAFECLASSFGGKLNKGDTITRFVTFTVDSNELLPQASMRVLIKRLKNGLIGGEVHGYAAKERSKWMSKNAIEQTFVYWDSTNQVEDPNHPGVFIYAPIKSEMMGKSFVIYERWVPAALQIHSMYGSPPQPVKSFRREVISYGIKMESGKMIWIDPVEMTLMLRDNFNWTPYEETFKAERYNKMKIQIQ